MIYQAYQSYSDLTAPMRAAARFVSDVCVRPWPGQVSEVISPRLVAAMEVFSRGGLTHERPAFGIDAVMVDGEPVAVSEVQARVEPFCTLLHFRKATDVKQPKVLIVAPLSGHFATLLRGTVRTMLRDHDVYITDWHNVRDVSLLAGKFDVDRFIDYIIRFLEHLGPGAHLMAVCQPTVAALAAAAAMAEANHLSQPRSISLMAGPIDTRINPTEVNLLATSKAIEWFEQCLIGSVPMRYAGAMRRVYPGFMQISAFMSMNLERHANSFLELYRHLVNADLEQADVIRDFYEEYFAMMDLPAEFYLQTVRSVFQEHHLPRGCFEYRGRPVDLGALKLPALLTIEGERDDICSIGQTLAAQDLCTGIRALKKRHYVQTGVGHYGVFSGRRWDNEIYPQVRDFIHQFN